MNINDYDVLRVIATSMYKTQRKIAEGCNLSLGYVNKSITNLIKNKYLDNNYNITDKTKKYLVINNNRNAIILAAGYGLRMVPINTETPKGLLEIRGEVLVERIIRQLHEVGIKEIHIVVGFMKEQYEYLIDKFGVNLIVNSDYSSSNNLHSLKLADKYISNTYIIPCDIWCENNPFNIYELYPWYMVTDSIGINNQCSQN